MITFPAIITSDLHLTVNPRDEYRWGLFDWLKQQKSETGAATLLILGDLTDAKDYHSSELVNRVVANLYDMSLVFENIYILMGNHDYLREGHGFFEFLNCIEGLHYLSDITLLGGKILFLPHSKNPKKDWADIPIDRASIIFMHQTVTGSVSSNGQKMDGEVDGHFGSKMVFSGDIHVPQDIADVTYVGSPYPVHFGDKFLPRVILLHNYGTWSDLIFPTISRFTATIKSVEELNRLNLDKGDQLKIKIDLPTSDLSSWDSIKKEVDNLCSKKGIQLESISLLPRIRKRIITRDSKSLNSAGTPELAVYEFAKQEDLGADLLDMGLEILE